MAEKKVFLVQGPTSAVVLAERFANETPSKWISYDAYAREILAEKKIVTIDEHDYFESDHGILSNLEEFAFQISTKWFQVIGERFPSHPQTERFGIRSFYYYLLPIFRAFYLLDKIYQREGPCHLYTTELRNKKEDLSYAGWVRDDSAIPLLLKEFNDRWNFTYRLINIQSQQKRKPTQSNTSKISYWASLFNHRIRKGQVLFSGNPSLLQPVARALQDNYKINSLHIRYVSEPFQSLLVLKKDTLLLSGSGRGKKTILNALEYLKIFEGHSTFHYNGLDFLKILRNRLEAYYREEVGRLSDLYSSAVNMFLKLKPGFVVLDEDSTEGNRLLACAANKVGIKTLVVSHGLPGGKIGFLPLEAKFIAVWGKHTKELLNRWGVHHDHIVVTGCPKYDFYYSRNFLEKAKTTKRNLCKRFNWSYESPIASIFPSGFKPHALERFEGMHSTTSEVFTTVEYFVRIAHQVPSVNFLLKFRLGLFEMDGFGKMASRLGGIPYNMRWVNELQAVDYMLASDFVFNCRLTASAGLEGMFLGKPVIVFNFLSGKDDFQFQQHGLQPPVTSYEEAKDLCEKLGEGKLPLEDWVREQERAIKYLAYANDGNSAKRVAEFIYHQLNN